MGRGGYERIYGEVAQFFCNIFINGLYYISYISKKGNTMSGPTHSNRNYKLMKPISMPEGDYIIEVWEGSNWDDDTKTREPVSGSIDIKVYHKIDDPSKYNKGEIVGFFRAWGNNNTPAKEDEFDDKIPF